MEKYLVFGKKSDKEDVKIGTSMLMFNGKGDEMCTGFKCSQETYPYV